MEVSFSVRLLTWRLGFVFLFVSGILVTFVEPVIPVSAESSYSLYIPWCFFVVYTADLELYSADVFLTTVSPFTLFSERSHSYFSIGNFKGRPPPRA